MYPKTTKKVTITVWKYIFPSPSQKPSPGNHNYCIKKFVLLVGLQINTWKPITERLWIFKSCGCDCTSDLFINPGLAHCPQMLCSLSTPYIKVCLCFSIFGIFKYFWYIIKSIHWTIRWNNIKVQCEDFANHLVIMLCIFWKTRHWCLQI